MGRVPPNSTLTNRPPNNGPGAPGFISPSWKPTLFPDPLKVPNVPALEEEMAEEHHQHTNGPNPVRVIVWYDYV